MTITVRELNNTNCKTYLLVSGKSAALVDPVRERISTYQAVLAREGLTLELVIETHTHADHLMINGDIKNTLGAQVVMHESSPIPLVDRHVKHGDRLELGDDHLEIFHTPGHTRDSLCIRGDGFVLTGDTLFIGGSGRTDFPGGDAGQQYDGIAKFLFSLPDDTVVWPGHDYRGNTQSTIGEEKATNPRLAGKSRSEYVQIMDELGLPFPDRIQEALQVNQSGYEPSEVHFPSVHDVAEIPQWSCEMVSALLKSDPPPVVLDVREPEEFVGELGHIEGALLVPMDALERRLPKLAGLVDRQVVVACRAGARSSTVAAILKAAGFPHVYNLDGGMVAWQKAGLPAQR